MRTVLLHFSLILALISLGTNTLQAQESQSYDTYQSLVDPEGITYTYNMKGDPKASDPSKKVPDAVIRANPDFCKRVSPNWISYALLHQLAVDRDLRDSAQMIIDAADYAFTREKPFTFLGELCRVANEITFGTGYYNFCPPYTAGEKTNDLKFTGSGYPDSTFTYEIHLNTQKKRIFVVEKLNGRVLEVNTCYVGKVVFENDFDPFYENPVPNPPRDMSLLADCQVFDPLADPTAVIVANPSSGLAPLKVSFDGSRSHDNDQDSQFIKSYFWDFGDGTTSEEEKPGHTFDAIGNFPVSLTVTDNEGATHSSTQRISVKTSKDIPPPPVPTPGPKPTPTPCPPCPPVQVQADSCWMMYYRIQSCNGRMDTLEKTPIRVQCPAPPIPKVVMTTCCCNDSIPYPILAQEPDSRIELAGGAVFKRYRGQLSEYSLGASGQIRYRFGDSRKWAGFVDLNVQPLRKATPLDDRPFKWSDLRDSIDAATGLPLVWQRGSERGTANLAVGAEFKPWKRIFLQGMVGSQYTFQQLEKSDPRKDPSNEFNGFDLQVFYGEFRAGVRSTHLEIFFAYQLLQENEPFTRIPANTQGGTFTPRSDKSYNVGVQILF